MDLTGNLSTGMESNMEEMEGVEMEVEGELKTEGIAEREREERSKMMDIPIMEISPGVFALYSFLSQLRTQKEMPQYQKEQVAAKSCMDYLKRQGVDEAEAQKRTQEVLQFMCRPVQ
jgi:hypothetical protein